MLFTLLACSPYVLSVGSDSGSLDSGPTTDTDTQTDTGPRSGIDFSTWSGTREFVYGDCQGRLEETGERLDEEWPQYFMLERYCADCDHWYQLSVGPETACGFSVTQRTFRGLFFQGADVVEIYSMDVGGEDGGHLSTGSWEEGHLIRYEYDIDTVRLTGLVEFELTSD